MSNLPISSCLVPQSDTPTEAFKHFQPELHKHYKETIEAICKDNPSLRRNYRNSVFAGAHFNLGPQTCTDRHTDPLNIVYGGCPVMAIGKFNSKLGGHLVLWDLRLVIRFPPGSLIILPSALIEHSNTPVGDDEERMSLAQYSAAGLFRWVHNGFKSDLEFQSTASAKDLKAWWEHKKTVWQEGLAKLRVF